MKIAQKLLLAAIITSTIFVAELIGGLLFGSLSLVADSFHVILDVAALLFSFLAIRLALRESNERYTFGYHRLEIFAALVNGILLSFAIFYIIYEAYHRFIDKVDMYPINIIIIAVIGLGANLVSMKLLGHRHDDINVRSAYLHVLGDTFASLAVIIGTLFILISGVYWVDPLVALIIVGILIRGTYRILKESISTLMQKSPIDTLEVKKWLNEKPKIHDVHDLHVWRLCSNIIVLTCHIVVESCELSEVCELREKLQADLSQKFGIQHSTIQFELECNTCSCDLCHKEHHHREDFTCPID
ncbi:MAG: cation transporter [Candidatus Helarchaeota archaeon]|nr:cation transporter [Candidatus Helarchaeota archaeon]